MNVESILRGKGREVQCAKPYWSVAETCRRMADLGIGALVVSADGIHVDGIFSERDVIRLIAEEGAEVLERRVETVMIRDVVTCSLKDDVSHLMETMTHRRIRHLPVTDKGELRGLVSIGDVVKNRIRESEREATALREYITAG